MARTEELKSFAENHNDFALAFYRQLLEKPGNLFFSPFSIRTVLAMTYAGARGETARQMNEALRFASGDETLHEALCEITGRLNAAGGGKYKMAVANALWSQAGAPLQTEFLEVVARYYGGGTNVVDFRRDAEAARGIINQWVEDRTHRRIRDLIPSGGLDADTRLVLVNAIYFKGMWVLQFRKALTRDEPFYLQDGGEVQAPLMHQQEDIRYLEAPGYQAVELEYRGGELSMVVLLPERKDGLRDLETKLSAGMLHDCVTKMRAREVKLFLPRFTFTWETELGERLRALGMRLALTRFEADFSGINGHVPPDEEALFISAVYHKAFVEVNERGTEAAAATGGVLVAMSASFREQRIPIFRADHPFLFAIRDGKSDAILFLGRVTDPTG